MILRISSLPLFHSTKKYFLKVDDRGLYASGQYWLQRKDVVGRAKGFVPYVGMVFLKKIFVKFFNFKGHNNYE